MGLERNGIVLKLEPQDSSLLEILRLDGDTSLLLEFAECSFLHSLARLDLSSETNKSGGARLSII